MNATTLDQAAEKRRRDLAAIHATAKKLQLDRDTYRAILVRVTGKDSSADLDAAQRRQVLEEFARLGAAKPRPVRAEHPGKPHNFNALPEMVTKIEAQLADMKLPWSYADAIGLRMFGIAKVAWLRKEEQLRAVIASLHVEQEKRDLNLAIDARLERLRDMGWQPECMVRLLKPLRPNWRRHRPSLQLVAEFLAEQLIEREEASA